MSVSVSLCSLWFRALALSVRCGSPLCPRYLCALTGAGGSDGEAGGYFFWPELVGGSLPSSIACLWITSSSSSSKVLTRSNSSYCSSIFRSRACFFSRFLSFTAKGCMILSVTLAPSMSLNEGYPMRPSFSLPRAWRMASLTRSMESLCTSISRNVSVRMVSAFCARTIPTGSTMNNMRSSCFMKQDVFCATKLSFFL